jgi:hypothetical protein
MYRIVAALGVTLGPLLLAAMADTPALDGADDCRP